METKDLIIAIIGYLLAILFPVIGVIYGLVLYFLLGDNPDLKKHGKYIIIVGVVILVIGIIAVAVIGTTSFLLMPH